MKMIKILPIISIIALASILLMPPGLVYSNDAATSGSGDDIMIGHGSKDNFNGKGGDDELFGEGGNDKLNGAGDDDHIDGGKGNDDIQGGSGNDDAFGDDGNDMMAGGEGNDRMWGGNGGDIMDGGTGNDDMDGGAGDDELKGGAGNDTVIGSSGNDELSGKAGDDILDGGDGIDQLFGDAGADDLFGDRGNDLLAAGNDTALANPINVLDGGDGTDQCFWDGGVLFENWGGVFADPTKLAFFGNDEIFNCEDPKIYSVDGFPGETPPPGGEPPAPPAPTEDDEIQALLLSIDGFIATKDLNKGASKGLIESLELAEEQYLANGIPDTTGCDALNAFVLDVNGLLDRQISADARTSLLGDAATVKGTHLCV